jgi:hypothetical protein
MNLDTYEEPSSLYRSRGEEVNPHRPLFTGDVLRDVPVPGTQDGGMALVLAHPCSFRAGGGQLSDRVLVCSVSAMSKAGANAWRTGFFSRMPLPDLDGPGFWAASLDEIGRALVDDLLVTQRLACLSDIGINMLQQRLTCHLTRAEVPTYLFNEAFSHTYDEAELLEEWTEALAEAGWPGAVIARKFEAFIRSGRPTLQERLAPGFFLLVH